MKRRKVYRSKKSTGTEIKGYECQGYIQTDGMLYNTSFENIEECLDD
jgi:hypothetical protein